MLNIYLLRLNIYLSIKMVVLFFAVNKGGKYTFSTRDFVEYLKKSVLNSVDQKKIVALDVTNIHFSFSSS